MVYMTDSEFLFYRHTCLVCEKTFSRLNDHLGRKHGMKIEEYSEKYPKYNEYEKQADLLKRKRIGEKSKGRLFTEEAKQKIAQKSKESHARKRDDNPEQYLLDQQARAAKARAAKGTDYRHSDETKQKMMGPRVHTRGIPKSQETREKLSTAAKLRIRSPASDETRDRMRKAWLLRKEKPAYESYICELRKRSSSDEHIQFLRNMNSSRMQNTSATSIELQLHNHLRKSNIDFESQYAIEYNGAWTYDVFIPSKNLLVEMDGEYWHGKSKEQINKDKLKERIAIANGFLFLRISDSDLNFDYLELSPDEMNAHNSRIIEKRENSLTAEEAYDMGLVE